MRFPECCRDFRSGRRRLAIGAFINCGQKSHRCQKVGTFLDLIFEDGRTNVHAGEREVRPPPALPCGCSVEHRPTRHRRDDNAASVHMQAFRQAWCATSGMSDGDQADAFVREFQNMRPCGPTTYVV